MKLAPVVCILLMILLAGCSSVSILPRPTTPGAVVNPSDQSIKINQSGLAVSARVQDTAVGGYEIETALASFYLTLSNQESTAVQVTLDAFSLIDSRGEIHKPVQPEEVNALLNPEISYFLPYPFVGYYDVVDLEVSRATSAMASERPYIGSGLPSIDILTPLPVGAMKRGQKISGMLYFKIEILDETSFELKASLPTGGRAGRRLDYSFPFIIEK